MAASSSASGRRSRRSQIASISAPGSNPGLTCRARAVNSSTASLRGERRDRVLLLAGDGEPLPAGDDRRARRRAGQQVADRRRGVDHLLDVVEHEQQRPLAQVGREVLDARRARPRSPGPRARVGDRRERHPPQPVHVAVGAAQPRARAQPRLARPARSRQRDQAVAPRDRAARRAPARGRSAASPVPADGRGAASAAAETPRHRAETAAPAPSGPSGGARRDPARATSASARVCSETTTCPPCAAEQIRAALCTAIPT